MKTLVLSLLILGSASANAATCGADAEALAVKTATDRGGTNCVDIQTSLNASASSTFTNQFTVEVVCDSDRTLPGSFENFVISERIKFREKELICTGKVLPTKRPPGE